MLARWLRGVCWNARAVGPVCARAWVLSLASGELLCHPAPSHCALRLACGNPVVSLRCQPSLRPFSSSRWLLGLAIGGLLTLASRDTAALDWTDLGNLSWVCAHAQPVEVQRAQCQAGEDSPSSPALPNETSAAGATTVAYQPPDEGVEQPCRWRQQSVLDGVARIRDYAQARAGILTSLHEVTVPASALTWGDYDAVDGAHLLDLRGGVALDGGRTRLRFGEMEALQFVVGRELRDYLEFVQAFTTLEVRLVFELAAAGNPAAMFCAPTAKDVVLIDVTLLGAGLRDASTLQEVAWLETPQLAARLHQATLTGETAEGSAAPRARLTNLVVEAAREPTLEAMTMWQMDLEARLVACYTDGLSSNSSLQGALVVGLQRSETQPVLHTEVLIDALDCSGLTRCVLEAVASSPLLPWPEGMLAGRATVTFEREALP